MSDKKRNCSFCGRVIDEKTYCKQGMNGVFICEKCISKSQESILAANMHVKNAIKANNMNKAQAMKLPSPRQIKDHLDQYIEGQEYAKKVLSVAVYNHYKMIMIKARKNNDEAVELEKANSLILGPSGVGKTAILKHLAKILKVPFVMTDATIYSSTGYAGADVEGIIKKLLHAANGNVKAAERGIVYIDEIDKTSRKGENLSTTADPGHEGVQQALLKLLEGTVIDIPENGRRIHPDAKTISVNTENILFIVGGAFEGIEKIIAKRLRAQNGKGLLGFDSDLVDRKNDKFNDFIPQVTVEDLRKFGMLPELLGRLPVIVPMQELTEEQLVNILYKPKNALIKQYEELLRHDGVKLVVTKEALQLIAKKALEKKTGARGLRGIMENILNPVMFEVPDLKENQVVLDAEKDEIKVTYEEVVEEEKVAWQA